MIIQSFLVLLLGYGLGSIPFGLLLTRAFGKTDIRTIGSGNIGATNVLRTGSKGLAAATLLLDALKGTLAVAIGYAFSTEAAMAGALGAFLGHIFPVWLGFKGGKGVATFLGCLLGLYWPAFLFFVALWIAVAFLTRFSSAAALAASAATPLLLLGLGIRDLGLLLLAMAALLWFMHRANIQRLMAGTEGKIGSKG